MKSGQNGRQLFRVVSIVILLALLAACGGEAPATLSEADSQATVAALVEAKAAQTAAAGAPAEVPVVEAPTAEPPADTPAPVPEPTVEAPAAQPQIMPGEPPEPNRTLEDVNSSYFAYEHKATAGENYLNNLFERPFTADEMIYQPDLDITTVDQSSDDAFYYFTIRLYGMNMQGGGLKGIYGIEFDRTLTGRGDLLVQVEKPTMEWSAKGVAVYGDRNRDVGGEKPVQAEAGFQGSGYDLVIELEGDKSAFARIDPDDSSAVQFAVSRVLLHDPEKFLWGAWADNGLNNPRWFDYNDMMGLHAAGSPIKGEDYSVKGIYNLDNTCRLPVGTGQTGTVPGMCKIGFISSSGSGEKECFCGIPGFSKADCISVNAWICK